MRFKVLDLLLYFSKRGFMLQKLSFWLHGPMGPNATGQKIIFGVEIWEEIFKVHEKSNRDIFIN